MKGYFRGCFIFELSTVYIPSLRIQPFVKITKMLKKHMFGRHQTPNSIIHECQFSLVTVKITCHKFNLLHTEVIL